MNNEEIVKQINKLLGKSDAIAGRFSAPDDNNAETMNQSKIEEIGPEKAKDSKDTRLINNEPFFEKLMSEKEEFETGMDEEMEHSDITGGDEELTKKIVEAHLKEDPHYYSKLKAADLIKAQDTPDDDPGWDETPLDNGGTLYRMHFDLGYDPDNAFWIQLLRQRKEKEAKEKETKMQEEGYIEITEDEESS